MITSKQGHILSSHIKTQFVLFKNFVYFKITYSYYFFIIIRIWLICPHKTVIALYIQTLYHIIHVISAKWVESTLLDLASDY